MKFKFVANKYIVPLLEKGKMLDLTYSTRELIRKAKKKNRYYGIRYKQRK